MTWEIFIGLVTFATGAVTIVGAIIKLNKAIVKLECAVENLNLYIQTQDTKNKEMHEKIEDHETRISILEKIKERRAGI